MFKKAIKSGVVLLVLGASIGSFVYLNSTSAKAVCPHTAASFEFGDDIPESHGVQSPNVAILKKAVVIAKCFLYPTE